MKIDISMSPAEELALSTIAVEPAGWIENFVRERVRVAIDGIVAVEVRRRLDAGLAVPATREEIVAGAFSEGGMMSAAKRQAAAATESERQNPQIK